MCSQVISKNTTITFHLSALNSTTTFRLNADSQMMLVWEEEYICDPRILWWCEVIVTVVCGQKALLGRKVTIYIKNQDIRANKRGCPIHRRRCRYLQYVENALPHKYNICARSWCPNVRGYKTINTLIHHYNVPRKNSDRKSFECSVFETLSKHVIFSLLVKFCTHGVLHRD